MDGLIEVYLKSEFYNPRVKATIPGAWIAVFDDGIEVAVCRAHEARTGAEAVALYEQQVRVASTVV